MARKATKQDVSDLSRFCQQIWADGRANEDELKALHEFASHFTSTDIRLVRSTLPHCGGTTGAAIRRIEAVLAAVSEA